MAHFSRNILLVIFCFFASENHARQNPIDSLLNLLKTDKPDTNKVIRLNELCQENTSIGSYVEGLKYGNLALQLASQLDPPFAKGIAASYHNIGVIYYYQSNFPEALKNYFAALKVQEKINAEHPGDKTNKRGIAASYNNLGLIYWNQGNYPDALKNYFSSLKIYEEIGDKKGIANSYNNIGNIYTNQGNYTDALKNYFTALKILEVIKVKHPDDGGNKQIMANSYNNIGAIYTEQANVLKKLEGSKPDSVKAKLTGALKNYFIALKLYDEIGDKEGITTSFINLGAVNTRLNKLTEAKRYLNKALALSKEIGDKLSIQDCYSGMAVLDSTKGDFKAAYEDHKQYLIYRDSIYNEETKMKTVQSAMTYDFEKKELATRAIQDKKDAVEAEEKRRQGYILLLVSCFLLLVLGFAVFAYRSYLQKKRINKDLEEKNAAIAEQKKIVEEKSSLITDSIEYAKSIQDVILPAESFLNERLPAGDGSWFVLFKPKDVVSGDFYWARPVKNKIFIAAIDCTGHGVPGAFMSLMAFNMLENIIIKKEFSQPSFILDELNDQVVNILHQQTESASVKYGMDIALIEIDKKSLKLEYAGAHNPLCIVRNNELIEVKADKTTIGMSRNKFINHTLMLQKNDMIYLFTDGFSDQKGGPEGKKFFAVSFKELLLSISKKEATEQKEILESTFVNWKGDLEQMDDVLVIGIKA